MGSTRFHTCNLCEAACGVAVTVSDGRVVDVRGDAADEFSGGYICPKATALADLHGDPDRLRRPVIRTGDEWREADWGEAYDLVARRLREVRAAHGKDAVAVYKGNPTTQSLGLALYGQLLYGAPGSRNVFSANSVDALPHTMAAYQVFGNQLLLPVPDIDRTELFVCLGANPLVSNGSLMTAPNMRGRLKDLRARGGRLVVIDPRRTETAQAADRHLFLRPGTDALLLLSLVHVLFDEQLVRTGRLTDCLSGVDTLRTASAEFAPEVTAPATGVPAESVRELARDLAGTERAVLYGRLGTCVQEFGGLAAWLLIVVNALTGHLDEPGGAMFTTPAIDLPALAVQVNGFDRWRSRVRGLPEFAGELPAAVLAEEIDTPGAGQIRALITVAGNPVLSTPNGARLEKGLPGLDFMVSIDPYINETTRFADVILPPTTQLERSHYPLTNTVVSVRDVAKYAPPVFQRGPDQRHDWEICVELGARLRGGRAGKLLARLLRRLPPEKPLNLLLRTGPHGLRRGGLSLRRVAANPHGLDLGPLQPRLPDRLPGRRGTIDLAPRVYLADLPRLAEKLTHPTDGLLLIGRRQLRNANSWLHNSHRLVKGTPRCTLLINPADAHDHGLADGDLAQLSTKVGTVDVPVEVTDTIMPGVVSLPHGWGHNRDGVRLQVATSHPGASVNDITDEYRVDQVTGTAAVTAIPVTVTARPTQA
jgi:anaerobic selenocysteine-containing dehydrogenase